ncbi:13731_t:CDS:2 [Acaulospora colombiana]|uniref:13731_t:CDS:1 n=1 Tax=Acaulospora colombiana TaxID=27376 RepID=A0ACA9MGE2_9GLOM|nr:13731_t:CDS:2 [Acaulospora colombiana]
MGNRKRNNPTSSPEVVDDIPDEEKIRLIKSTGLLKDLKESKKGFSEREVKWEDDPFAYGFTFQAFLYTIPLCAVYSVMDILVHRQYNQEILILSLITRVVKVAPICVYTYFTYMDFKL